MFTVKTLVGLTLSGLIALTANSAILETSDVNTIPAVIKFYEPHTNTVTMMDTTKGEWVFEDFQLEADSDDIYEIKYFEKSYEPISVTNKQEGTTWNLLND